MENKYLLQIKDLAVEYHTDEDTVYAVNNISLGAPEG
jgi:ABC-type microcin C transport system duplicated ATPase subunit YejF